MNKITRLYNQNRVSFWTTILVIVFIISIIQLLNYFAKQKNENKAKQNSNTVQETYINESQSIISEGSVSTSKRTTYGKIIDEFLTNCIEGKFEEAYEILSNDCKEVYYNSLEKFENLYCKNKFSSDKTYSFQSWISGKKDIYQVKIFDDMLSTGKVNNNKYIEDFYTIVKEDGKYKLNINSFIGKDQINKEKQQDNIILNVESVDIYKECCIYTINVKNESDNTIKIDSKKETNTVYIEDDKQVKFIGLLNENIDKDLIIEANQEKKIKIKVNVIYRDDLDIKKLVFSDIIRNYDINEEDNVIKVEIDV